MLSFYGTSLALRAISEIFHTNSSGNNQWSRGEHRPPGSLSNLTARRLPISTRSTAQNTHHNVKGAHSMKPLRGMKVLDLTTLNGFATMTLADYGAEVIKVERPGAGDPIRSWEPLKEGVSPYQAFLDRGKKSITLDLTREDGRELFKQLVKHVDVVVENFKYGKMEKLGLGYAVLESINPRIILASMTGFGTQGPWRDYPAFDIIVQAKSGFMEFTGFPDEPPTLIGFPISDQYTCLYLASAITSAYFHVLRTGEGQHVETSLWEGLFSAQEDKMMYTELGLPPKRLGNAHPDINPYDIIRCKDGYMTLGISTDPQWAAFCKQFGKPEWAEDPRYRDMEPRGKNYFNDLREKLEDLLQNYTMQELDEGCIAAKVPAAPCNSIIMAMNDPQVKIRNMVVEVEDARLGTIKMVGKTAKYHQDKEHDNIFESAPALGEHNKLYFQNMLGLGETELARLSASGII